MAGVLCGRRAMACLPLSAYPHALSQAPLVGSENETQALQLHTQTKEKESFTKTPSHRSTMCARAAKFMLVMFALLLAPLLGNAEYEFHWKAVPSLSCYQLGLIGVSGADRRTPARLGWGTTSILWLHRRHCL